MKNTLALAVLGFTLAACVTTGGGNTPLASTKTSESGLIYTSLVEGSGEKPNIRSSVTVHYRGTLTDGREFDSSYKRGQPARFPLTGVIKCWTEGVQMMKVGGKARLTCPPAIAYGERGAGALIPPNATLNFEIELLGVVDEGLRK